MLDVDSTALGDIPRIELENRQETDQNQSGNDEEENDKREINQNHSGKDEEKMTDIAPHTNSVINKPKPTVSRKRYSRKKQPRNKSANEKPIVKEHEIKKKSKKKEEPVQKERQAGVRNPNFAKLKGKKKHFRQNNYCYSYPNSMAGGIVYADENTPLFIPSQPPLNLENRALHTGNSIQTQFVTLRPKFIPVTYNPPLCLRSTHSYMNNSQSRFLNYENINSNTAYETPQLRLNKPSSHQMRSINHPGYFYGTNPFTRSKYKEEIDSSHVKETNPPLANEAENNTDENIAMSPMDNPAFAV